MSFKKLTGIVTSATLSLLFITTPVLLAEGLIPVWLGLVVSLVPTIIVLGLLITKAPLLRIRVLVALSAIGCALIMSKFGVFEPQNIYLINFIAIYSILFKEFAGSLGQNETPLCTRFAMLVHETISIQVAKYTRVLTYIWAAFFGLQIPIWLTLFFTLPTELWSELISLVPPILMLCLFAMDITARRLVLPYEDRKDSLARTIRSITKHRNNLKQAVAK